MILNIKGSWSEVLDNCRSTVNKGLVNKEPSVKFKREILISEHSPIRSISIRWIWRSIKSWVATHWSRHKWECYISTSRTDRTGINRDELPQSHPVDFIGDANPQQLIDTMRKRLCNNSSPETRTLAFKLKKELHKSEPEISDVLVPNCIYRCGCPEMEKCGAFEKFLKESPFFNMSNIQQRYDVFNKYLEEKGW